MIDGRVIRSRRWLPAVSADLACVLVFAIAGKTSHEENASTWIVLAIVWPYALAAGLAHLTLLWRGRRTSRVWPEGAIVLAVVYLLGMALRAASGRGLATGFLVVAVVFLGATLLGWRALLLVAARRRATRSA